MSRSYRRPYTAITGASSSKEDKRFAARGLRRAQNRWTRSVVEFDDDMIPHRYECPHNDVWGWRRDGNHIYTVPKSSDCDRYRSAAWLAEYYASLRRK